MRGGDANSEMISSKNERPNGLKRSLDGGDHYDDFPSCQRRNLESMFYRYIKKNNTAGWMDRKGGEELILVFTLPT